MNMQSVTLARRPNGDPLPEDFSLQTKALPDLADGEVLIEASHFSLDPYMRGRMDEGASYAPGVPIGETMVGQGVGRVIASKAEGFAVGDIATGMTGWASHGVVKAAEARVLPADVPPSLFLGVLGMPGFTAWTGLQKYGHPKAGETLVVAAATGPVGAMVGQLAKAAGLRAVAIAGGAEKCRLAVERFGFDAAIDHRAYADASSLRKAIATEAPDGIDIYWENTGGKVLEAVIPLMNIAGRIPICGTIAWYGNIDAGEDQLPKVWRSILVKRLQVSGFIIFDHWDGYPAFVEQVTPQVLSGEIKYLEDVAQGLVAAPQAFISMLKGGNTGKQIVAL